MIPYLLAAVGGYLIGDSVQSKNFADGEVINSFAKGGKVKKTIGKSGIEYDVLKNNSLIINKKNTKINKSVVPKVE